MANGVLPQQDIEPPKRMSGLKGKLDLNALAAEMIAMEAKKGL